MPVVEEGEWVLFMEVTQRPFFPRLNTHTGTGAVIGKAQSCFGKDSGLVSFVFSSRD